MRKLKVALATIGILAMSAVLSLNMGRGAVNSQENGTRVYTAHSNSTVTSLTCLFNALGTYTFLDVPAGDVAITVRVPIKPTTAGSNGSIWLTDALGNVISTSNAGMHSSQDADYVVNKMTFRDLHGSIVDFAGGTLVIKLTGQVEACGHTFSIGNNNAVTDPRWWVNVLVTVN